MRSFLIGMAVLVFLLLALAPAVAEGPSTVKAKIDFAFWVGGQQFQPGEYIFKTTDSNKHFLTIIQGFDNKKQQYALTQDLPQLGTAKTSKLVFRRDGDKYILHQIWAEGDTHAHDVAHAVVAVDQY